MTNKDRILNWREKQAAQTGGKKRTKAKKPESRKPDGVDAVSPEKKRKRDVAATLLPSDRALQDELGEIDERRANHSKELRRQLAWFVGLPVLLTAFYALVISTPFYRSYTSFTISTVDDTGPGIALAGIGGGGASRSLVNLYRVREYLLSRDAMLQMEKRTSFMEHFRSQGIDPLSKPLDLPALGIQPHDFYKRRVHIAVDLQQNIVRLEVDAADAEIAQRFAAELLLLGKEKVDAFSNQLNEDQLKALERSVIDARGKVREASARVARIQRLRVDINPEATTRSVYQILNQLEVAVSEAENERRGLLSNGLTESPLLPRLNSRIAALKSQIDKQKRRLVGPQDRSLQKALIDFEDASARKKLADVQLESAMRVLGEGRLRALEQRPYLLMLAKPTAPASATVGRAPYLVLLVSLLALLLFGLIATVRRTTGYRTLWQGWRLRE